jgi:branched-chain amino acid transport system permease protein
MENFLQLTINGILLGSVYALVALGLTLIFGVMDIVNFAHGEFLMLSMYVTFWLFQLCHIDPYLSSFIVIPVFFAMGMITQKIIIDPLIGRPNYVPLFATAGLGTAMQNAALFFWKSDYRIAATSYSNTVLNLGSLKFQFPLLIALFGSVLVMIALTLILKKTLVGKAIRAVAQNPKCAALMGINLRNIYYFTFGVGTASVGVAGVLLAPCYYIFPMVGFHFVIVAFVIVVLGGMGNLFGAFAGGLIIGLVEQFSGFFLDPHLKEAIYFIIFITILWVRPRGLFGKAGK